MASLARVRRLPKALIDRIVLKDGRAVAMRPVIARDAAAAQAFVRGLSATSRHLRFHIAIRELPPDLLRAMTDVDQRCHVAVVAEVQDEDAVAHIVADARYVRSVRPGEAEFAIAVADAWQGVGLGRALLQRLLRHAGRRGITRLVGDVVHANLPMISLVRSRGGRFVAVPGVATLMRAVFDLSASTAAAALSASQPEALNGLMS